jgi:hypothetical protein
MMDKQKLKHLEQWRVRGIFAQDRCELFEAAAEQILQATGLTRVVYLHDEGGDIRFAGADETFVLQHMTKRYTDLLAAMDTINDETLLIVDDVENIQRYPISMTRHMINHIASQTRYKIIGGASLLERHFYDLYAPFHVLDRRILWASHYWALKAQHREVSVFDGRTVVENKDMAYTARKIKPFVYFDLQPDSDNPLQVEFYGDLRRAPIMPRTQDMEDLKL